MHDNMDRFFGMRFNGGMMIMMIIFFIAVVLLIVEAVKYFRNNNETIVVENSKSSTNNVNALELLKERYALGEITTKEFKERKANIFEE